MNEQGKRSLGLGATFLGLWVVSVALSVYGFGEPLTGLFVPAVPLFALSRNGTVAPAALLAVVLLAVFAGVKRPSSLIVGVAAHLTILIYWVGMWWLLLVSIRY